MPRAMTCARISVTALALLLVAAIPATASAAPSAALVQVAPQAFESKQPLLGYLTRPHTKGPFPAVVLLHGCAGFGPRETNWADRLRSWGYVALAIDSFTPRKMTRCNGPTSDDDAVDAFSALQYLTTQSFVIPDRVAVLGSSLGAIAAVDDVENSIWEQMYRAKFRAAVAFYPSCTGDSGMVSVPTLILIGEKDDWAWAHACREMVENANKKGAPIKLVVYSDATHDFDVPATVPYQILGHHMAYDPEATQDAERQVRDFLHGVLKRPSSVQATPSVK
jgi:dienelactone hydrolase